MKPFVAVQDFVKKWVKVEYAVMAAVLIAVASLFITPGSAVGADSEATNCENDDFFCRVLVNDDSAASTIEHITSPEVKKPDWLASQERQAQQNERNQNGDGRTVTYQIQTRGNIQSGMEGFAQLVAETYADNRGWSRAGIAFQRVEGGGQFILVLSEASQMTSFSSGCDTIYSCRVGPYVIINEDRWLGATDSWNSQGGSLRDYRHMVINHETGHWLGHGHYNCSGAGQLAPVMQQQSIDLQGCKFNPWPLDFEISST